MRLKNFGMQATDFTYSLKAQDTLYVVLCAVVVDGLVADYGDASCPAAELGSGLYLVVQCLYPLQAVTVERILGL